jgi:hypothetical protein
MDNSTELGMNYYVKEILSAVNKQS